MPPQASKTNLTSPTTWLTKDYLQDKLRKRRNDSKLIVSDMELNQDLIKGENYSSNLWHMKVFYRSGNSSDEQSASIIVKSILLVVSSSKHVMSDQYGFFKREMRMCDQILPKLQDFIYSFGDKDKICPRTIYVDYDHAAIIFEDLRDSGYKPTDRIACFDLEHTQLAMKKLAKLHAAAAVLNEKSPELFTKDLDRGFFNRHTRALKPVFLGIYDALTRYIAKQPELKERYYEKLLSLRERIMEYGERAHDVNPAHFMTLNHGDFWHMNVMFKYDRHDTKMPIDMVPIDYQSTVWASPAIDLHYFFNNACCDEVRLHHQAKLVQYYYKALLNNLKTFGFQGNVPSLFEFRMQIEARSFYGLISALIFQPVNIIPEIENHTFANLIFETESGKRFKDAMFKNVRVQKYLKDLLPIFDEKGLLDNMDSIRL